MHFASALFSKDMLRTVKGFALWILFDCFEEKFYIHWSAGRSPRVHEVNPGRGPSYNMKVYDNTSMNMKNEKYSMGV